MAELSTAEASWVPAPVQEEVPSAYSPIEEAAEEGKPKGKPRKPQRPSTDFWPSSDQEVKFSSEEEGKVDGTFEYVVSIGGWLHTNHDYSRKHQL